MHLCERTTGKGFNVVGGAKSSDGSGPTTDHRIGSSAYKRPVLTALPTSSFDRNSDWKFRKFVRSVTQTTRRIPLIESSITFFTFFGLSVHWETFLLSFSLHFRLSPFCQQVHVIVENFARFLFIPFLPSLCGLCVINLEKLLFRFEILSVRLNYSPLWALVKFTLRWHIRAEFIPFCPNKSIPTFQVNLSLLQWCFRSFSFMKNW